MCEVVECEPVLALKELGNWWQMSRFVNAWFFSISVLSCRGPIFRTFKYRIVPYKSAPPTRWAPCFFRSEITCKNIDLQELMYAKDAILCYYWRHLSDSWNKSVCMLLPARWHHVAITGIYLFIVHLLLTAVQHRHRTSCNVHWWLLAVAIVFLALFE